MKKLSGYFKNSSIFLRLSMIIVIIFILIIGVFSITASHLRKEKLASIFSAVNQNNHEAISKIEDYITDISNITKIPLTYKQLDDAYINYLYEFNINGTNSYEFQKFNEQIFEEIFTYKNSVNSCFVFNLSGAGDYKVRDAIYQPFNPIEEAWFTDCIDAFGKPVLVDTYELPNLVNEKLKPVYVFGIARGIVQLKRASVIGVLLVNTRISYFDDIYNNMKLTDNHRIVILHDGYTIYDSVTENIAAPAEEALLTIPKNTEDAMYSLILNKEKMLAASVTSNQSGWTVISLIPEAELFMEINQIQRENMIMIMIVMLLALYLLFFASRQIVNPIKRLSKIMKIAESGDFNTHIQINRMDEVGMLSASYNSMLDKINELIQEVYFQKITASELELQMLQSQINPHFLYNTLESISMMATINDDDSTAEMAALLGSILRYSISNMDQLVTLSDEITQIQKYISLQERRFHSQFQIEVDIDQKYYSIVMPKLILQPIVENAIYHGMSSMRSNGKITISADKPDHTTLLLVISDNGIGMSEKKVQELNGYINEENNLFKSIGMRNVNRRIQLFCGSDYGVNIQSSPDKGTTVYVRIRIDAS